MRDEGLCEEVELKEWLQYRLMALFTEQLDTQLIGRRMEQKHGGDDDGEMMS